MNYFDLQTQLCTEEKLDCVSNLKVDNSDCLQQCSGVLVTSYDQQDIEDISKKNLIKYISGKSPFLKDMRKEFQGLS